MPGRLVGPSSRGVQEEARTPAPHPPRPSPRHGYLWLPGVPLHALELLLVPAEPHLVQLLLALHQLLVHALLDGFHLERERERPPRCWAGRAPAYAQASRGAGSRGLGVLLLSEIRGGKERGVLFSSTILSGFLPPLTNWAWPRAWLRPVNRSTQNSSRGLESVRERILFSLEKEGHSGTCYNVDES